MISRINYRSVARQTIYTHSCHICSQLLWTSTSSAFLIEGSYIHCFITHKGHISSSYYTLYLLNVFVLWNVSSAGSYLTSQVRSWRRRSETVQLHHGRLHMTGSRLLIHEVDETFEKSQWPHSQTGTSTRLRPGATTSLRLDTFQMAARSRSTSRYHRPPVDSLGGQRQWDRCWTLDQTTQVFTCKSSCCVFLTILLLLLYIYYYCYYYIYIYCYCYYYIYILLLLLLLQILTGDHGEENCIVFIMWLFFCVWQYAVVQTSVLWWDGLYEQRTVLCDPQSVCLVPSVSVDLSMLAQCHRGFTCIIGEGPGGVFTCVVLTGQRDVHSVSH